MLSMTTLDDETVRTFVMGADFRSFMRAAEVLDLSDAISVKLKRLKDGLRGHKGAGIRCTISIAPPAL